jgi:hypothetical protein
VKNENSPVTQENNFFGVLKYLKFIISISRILYTVGTVLMEFWHISILFQASPDKHTMFLYQKITKPTGHPKTTF